MAFTRSEQTLRTPEHLSPRPGLVPAKEVIQSLSPRPIDLTRVVDAEAAARVEHLDMYPGELHRELNRRSAARAKAARDWHRVYGADE